MVAFRNTLAPKQNDEFTLVDFVCCAIVAVFTVTPFVCDIMCGCIRRFPLS